MNRDTDGRTDVRARTETALAAARSRPARHAFVTLTGERARREAADGAARRVRGLPPRPLEGVPVVYKDNIDVAGTRTTAGSLTRARWEPAGRDAALVRRLTAAGAVCVGKTVLAEFAFGGLGTNAHFGTPRNPYRASAVPGGSSSGTAVAVATGVAPVGIGTDTSGSVRVPAALCGLYGFKPSRARYPRSGVLPLAPSLDTVGVMARSVSRLLAVDAVLAADGPPPPTRPEGVTLVVPEGAPVEALDPAVRERFEATLETLAASGVRVRRVAVSALDATAALFERCGSLVAHEAARTLPAYLARGQSELLDPRVRERLEVARRDADPADRATLLTARAHLRRQVAEELGNGLLALPTTACTAPGLAEVTSAAGWHRLNARVLGTTMLTSYLDMPGMSLPMRPVRGMPAGLLLSAPTGDDHRVLAAAACLERPLLTGG